MSQPILSVSDLHVHIGTRDILTGASLSVNRGERIGIVGRNGCGKSTFLRIAAAVDTAHAGEVSRRRGTRTGFLPQSMELNPEQTVRDAVRDGAADILELIRRYEEEGDDDLEPELNRLDAWRLESRIDELLDRLEAPPADAVIAPLSGGEKRRVALCRALAAQPDLLLLDEPTNHLDMAAIDWLATWLARYPGAVMLVTHDRHFLDATCTRMVELRGGQFDSYPGNYSAFIQGKAERLAAEAKAEAKRQSFLRREIEWVRRGPPARTTKSQARLDRYYDAANADGPLQEDSANLLIPPPPRLANKVINVSGVGMSLGGKRLFKDLDLKIEGGMRLGIIGPNGCGKSTLLKIIQGQLTPDEGDVEIAEHVVFNTMDQDRLALEDNKTVFESIGDGNETVPFAGRSISARAYLKNMLFDEDRLPCKVSVLSGGERSRLVLAKMLLRGGNILILDEPTNDLDIDTLRVLEDALDHFPGVLITVSHDRRFLDRVSTHTIAFDGRGKVTIAIGNASYHFESTKPTPVAKTTTPKAKPPAQKGLSRDEQKELSRVEKKIGKIEEAIEAINTLFADNEWCTTHADELTARADEQKALEAELEEQFGRWEELQEKAGA